MSVLLSLLAKGWPYLLAAGLASAGSVYLTHKADSIAYNSLQAKYSEYVSQVQVNAANAQALATKALQDQIAKDHDQDAANEKTLTDLNAKLASTESDRDFARRLLNAAKAANQPHSDPPGKTPNQSGTNDPSSGDGNQQAASLLGLLADSAGECSAAIYRLDALQRELKPQL